MSGHDPQRTGRSSFVGPTTAPAAPDWVFTTPAPIVGDIVVSADGKLYFASDKLYALNPDGSLFGSAVVGAAASTPAIDDKKGVIYVAVANAVGGFDILRLPKTLQTSTVIAQVPPAPFGGTISPLILSPDGTLYFVVGRFPGRLFSVGVNSWSQPVCPTESNANAPAISGDSSIYVSCDGQMTKREPINGTELANAFEDRHATEPVIDSLGRIRAGWQAFTGATFCGDYKAWDSALTPLPSSPCGLLFASSRAAVLGDGVSTARIGFAFFPNNFLEAEGAHTWSLVTDHTTIPNFSSVPSSDAQGTIYIGTEVGLKAISPVDGHTVWSFTNGDLITTQPIIGAGGAIFVGSKTGKVYGFNTRTLAILGVSPTALNRGQSEALLRITGIGFRPGAVVALDDPNITINTTVIASTEIDLSINIPVTVAIGAHNVVVSNPEGSKAAASFTILPEIVTRTAPFDLSTDCDATTFESNGQMHASSNSSTGVLKLRGRSDGVGSAVGRSGLGVIYDPPFSGTAEVRATVILNEGSFDGALVTPLPFLDGFGIASFESAAGLLTLAGSPQAAAVTDIRSTLLIPKGPVHNILDDAKTISNIIKDLRKGDVQGATALAASLKGILFDARAYDSSQSFTVTLSDLPVTKGAPIPVCAIIFSKVKTEAPPFLAFSEVLYQGQVANIEILPTSLK